MDSFSFVSFHVMCIGSHISVPCSILKNISVCLLIQKEI